MAKSSFREENFTDTVKELLPGFLKILGVVLVIGLIVWGVAQFSSSSKSPELSYQKPENVFGIIRDYNPSQGPKDAKVVVMIVEDPQCPNCGVYEDIVENILPNYTDKVRFVTKMMPLEKIHNMARDGSRAMYAAQKQDKFKEYSKILFDNQTKLSLNQLDVWAKDLGLDADKFRKDRTSQQVDFWISSDQKDLNDVRLPANTENAPQPSPGVEAGRLSGTPSTVIFVNGEVFDWWSGAVQQEQLVSQIEKAIAKSEGKEVKVQSETPAEVPTVDQNQQKIDVPNTNAQ